MGQSIYFPKLMRQDLSRQLKMIRKIIGLQGKDVAKELGIDPSNLTRIEHGQYNYGVDTLIRIADFYGFKIQIVLDCSDVQL